MTFAIRIKESSQNNAWLFERTFATEQEYQTFVGEYCHNRATIGFFKSLVIPVRTNTLCNFCQDFFLPTFFNYAVKKTHDIALLIFESIGCLVWDVISFPLRVITAIPRYFVNASQPRELHPLHRYLVAQGADPRLLNQDWVHLKLEYVEWRIGPGEYESGRKQTHAEEVFNFIELPKFAKPVQMSWTSRGLPRPAPQIEVLE